MKPILFTINVGNVLSHNARRSFMAACSRWGCSYLEVTGSSRFGPKVHPCFTKFEVFAELKMPLVYMDADVLIPASMAESPFEHLGYKDGVFGVLDAQSHYAEDQRQDILTHVHAVHYEFVHECMIEAGSSIIDANRFMRNPINGGVLVSPRPDASVELAFSNALKGAERAVKRLGGSLPNGHVEQAFLNYALDAHGVRGTIPENWNRIAPPLTGSLPKACLHFTGPNYLTPELRKARVASVEWEAL